MPVFTFRLHHALLGGALLVSSLPSVAAPTALAPVAPIPGSPASPKLPRAAAPATIDPTRYVLGPEDVVSVVVLRHPEFSANEQVIPGSGALLLPIVGSIRFAGRTIPQIDAEVTNKLRGRLLRPEVNISLARPRPRPVYVQGAVKAGGVYEFKNGWRITQALSAAGGLGGDADLAAVSVTRNGKIILDTLILPILNDATGKSNIALQVGDSLRFYQRVVNVSVSGSVVRPGVYPLPRGSGIVDAVGLAGGPAEGATLSKATIRRASGAIIAVNLFKALREGDKSQDLTLKEGDSINIPATQERVSVLGEVKNQGPIRLEDGRVTRVSDAIALAGGPTETAALTRATLNHNDGTTQPINLYQLISKGDKSVDLELKSGDIINVPRAQGITVTGEVNRGGTVYLEEGAEPRVLDAIAAAQNLNPNLKPERARIIVTRVTPEGKVLTLSADAPGLLNQTDAAQNLRLQPGDVVTVSSIARALVTIDGEVKVPGQYEIDAGDSVAQVIARAGGVTVDGALSRVSIQKAGATQSTFVSYVDAIKKGGAQPDFPLQNGDRITVPRSDTRVNVLGAVNRAGVYALPEDRIITIGDLITFAGGTAPQAKTKEVALFRKAADGTVTSVVYPMDRPTKEGVLAVNVPIQNGDLLFVPTAKAKPSVLSTIASAAGAVGTLALGVGRF